MSFRLNSDRIDLYFDCACLENFFHSLKVETIYGEGIEPALR